MATNLNQMDSISKETIQAASIEYRAAKNLSQRELATKCGIKSETVITHIEKGKFDLVSDANFRKVWNVVRGGYDVIVQTCDFVSIKNLCDRARSKKQMLGLLGEEGMGKTFTLKLLASRKANTFYVVFDATMRAKQFFAAILKEMGIAFEGNIHDMVNRIAEELNTTPNPLLIIDEAGKINHNLMQYLHCLKDKTEGNCGIVLSGMPYFKNNLIKNSNKQKQGYSEFFRRINHWFELSGLTKQEITLYCNQKGITDEDEVRELFRFKKFGYLVNALNDYNTED